MQRQSHPRPKPPRSEGTHGSVTLEVTLSAGQGWAASSGTVVCNLGGVRETCEKSGIERGIRGVAEVRLTRLSLLSGFCAYSSRVWFGLWNAYEIGSSKRL